MLVREIMKSPVTTIPPDVSLVEACKLLQALNIRHLPVTESGRLVGVLTDRDVRFATSTLCPSPHAATDSVRCAMTTSVLTADPGDPIEEAARVMRTHKIGCLPVVEGNLLVGIITDMDLLDAILRLAGIYDSTGRLEVSLSDVPGELARLTSFLGQRNVNIRSILTYPTGQGSIRTVLRVDTNQTPPLADALREAHFAVLWPMQKPWLR
jgi:acetoin utilization protein AcuB